MARTISYACAVAEGLRQAALRDPSVLFMAEGIDDPTAVFGTLSGLRDAIGDARVIEMPVAENGLTGVAIGAAMLGKRVVLSFHRVEFALLAMEQIVNNAAKAHYASNGLHRAPIVIRLIVGRGWGQGPAHSQSLEAVFAHIPGLKVVMPAYPRDAKGLLVAAVEDDSPVVCIEHRWCHYVTGDVPEDYLSLPLDGPAVLRRGSDVTIVATSYMTLEAMRAADALRAIGCEAEIIDLRVVRPLVLGPIVDSVRRTHKLLAVDTGFRAFGVGAEICASVTELAFDDLTCAPERLGLPEHPTPSARSLIGDYYPSAATIVRAAGRMAEIDEAKIEDACTALANARGQLPLDVPDPFFKGPF